MKKLSLDEFILPTGFCMCRKFELEDIFLNIDKAQLINIKFDRIYNREDLFYSFCTNMNYEGEIPKNSWDLFLDVVRYCCSDFESNSIIFILEDFDKFMNLDIHDSFTLISDLCQISIQMGSKTGKIVNTIAFGESEGFKDVEKIFEVHNMTR